MNGDHLFAVYENLFDAQRVCSRLEAEGIARKDIRLIRAGESERDRRRGFFTWLTGTGTPDTGKDAYLYGDRAAISVSVDSGMLRLRAIEIMQENQPIDIEHEKALSAAKPEAARRKPPVPVAAAEPVVGPTPPIVEPTLPGEPAERAAADQRIVEERVVIEEIVVRKDAAARTERTAAALPEVRLEETADAVPRR